MPRVLTNFSLKMFTLVIEELSPDVQLLEVEFAQVECLYFHAQLLL